MPTFDAEGAREAGYTETEIQGAQRALEAGYTPEEISTHLSGQFANVGGQQPSNSIVGSAKAIGSGLVNAGIGMTGLPGDIQGAARALLPQAPAPKETPAGTYGSFVSALEKARSMLELPTSEGIRGAIESKTGPLDYQPQTGLEGYLKTGAEFAPGLASPGGAIRKIAQTFIPAVASEAAGQATAGTPSEPIARLGGALAGGIGVGKTAEMLGRRAINVAAPTAAELKNDAQNIYNRLTAGNNAVPVSNIELRNLAKDIRDTLNRQGVRPSVASSIHAAVNEIEIPATKNLGDVSDLVAARQNIKGLLSSPDSNRAGAAIALPKIDTAIEQFSPGTMADLRAADQNYSTFKANEALDKKMVRAELRAAGEHSGLNLGNKIRQKTTDYLLNNESRFISPETRSDLESVVRGTLPQNAVRMTSNLLGGGGGLGMTMLGLGATAAGGYMGHPEAALLPLGGVGLRMAGNRMVAKQASNAAAAMRARSPLGQARGAPQSLPSGLTPVQAATLGAVLSSNDPRSLGLLGQRGLLSNQ